MDVRRKRAYEPAAAADDAQAVVADPAVLGARRHAHRDELLLQPRDLALGLLAVLLEGGGQLARLRGLGHLGQGLQELVFGAVQVLQFINVQFSQRVEFHRQSSKDGES